MSSMINSLFDRLVSTRNLVHHARAYDHVTYSNSHENREDGENSNSASGVSTYLERVFSNPILWFNDDIESLGRLLEYQNPITYDMCETLPIVKMDVNFLDKYEDCSICLVKYSLDETKDVIVLTCKHAYHAFCIKEWFKKHNTCPLCRHPTFESYILPDEEIYSNPDSLATFDSSDSESYIDWEDEIITDLNSIVRHFDSDSEGFPQLVTLSDLSMALRDLFESERSVEPEILPDIALRNLFELDSESSVEPEILPHLNIALRNLFQLDSKSSVEPEILPDLDIALRNLFNMESDSEHSPDSEYSSDSELTSEHSPDSELNCEHSPDSELNAEHSPDTEYSSDSEFTSERDYIYL